MSKPTAAASQQPASKLHLGSTPCASARPGENAQLTAATKQPPTSQQASLSNPMKRMTQVPIPGTESDLDADPELRDAIHAALDADDELASYRATAKARHDTVLRLLAERGRDSYPYVDARTGKRKLYVADKTPRPKKIAAAGSPKAKRTKTRDVEIGEEIVNHTRASAAAEEAVEKRRVSRKSVEAEIDPFAATRKQLEH